MNFKDYQSKPVVRSAHEVSDEDSIVKVGEATYQINEELIFKAYEPVVPGDFIVYLTAEDVYHCSRSVFLERNIVPE